MCNFFRAILVCLLVLQCGGLGILYSYWQKLYLWSSLVYVYVGLYYRCIIATLLPSCSRSSLVYVGLYYRCNTATALPCLVYVGLYRCIMVMARLSCSPCYVTTVCLLCSLLYTVLVCCLFTAFFLLKFLPVFTVVYSRVHCCSLSMLTAVHGQCSPLVFSPAAKIWERTLALGAACSADEAEADAARARSPNTSADPAADTAAGTANTATDSVNDALDDSSPVGGPGAVRETVMTIVPTLFGQWC